jgi:hypothetical protein
VHGHQRKLINLTWKPKDYFSDLMARDSEARGAVLIRMS